MFIGYYSIANAVTLFGLISAVMSCFLAASGPENIKFAVLMLFMSMVCDMFDGKIARSTPNRGPRQQFFGVQLDSLCDVISFGVTPCFIAFSFGFNGVADVLIYIMFVCCGAIRLAYFNTLANENPGKTMKYYRGIPIPVSCFVMTVLILLTTFIPANVTVWLFRLVLFVLGLGFIANIRIKKPAVNKLLILAGIQVLLIIILFIAGDVKVPVA